MNQRITIAVAAVFLAFLSSVPCLCQYYLGVRFDVATGAWIGASFVQVIGLLILAGKAYGAFSSGGHDPEKVRIVAGLSFTAFAYLFFGAMVAMEMSNMLALIFLTALVIWFLALMVWLGADKKAVADTV